MPAPFSPDPHDSPHDPPGAKTPSTQNSTEQTHDPHGVTPLAAPTPPNSEPPTVITGNRPRAGAFDPNLGNALAGRKLGHFELIESVGAGGMGAVLRARDLDLGRTVALKILPPDMAADPENIVRFKQEARAAARLDHENIARVYFFGEDQGLHFIAFEFVEGDNLRQLMTAHGGSIAVPEAVSLMLQVTLGLAHAAERGVVHRDIKPSNIIVTPDGRAKIVDMGLARSLDPKSHQLTESGVTLGTFDYISPEQALEPRSADVRSDIYSLGCTFYHALTGQLPVPEGNAAKKLDAQKNLVPPDPRGFNTDIPEDVVQILGRMMAKDPDRRYQDPHHLAAHLRSIARRLGVPVGPAHAAVADPLPRRRLSAAWALTAIAVLGLFVLVLANTFRDRGPVVQPPDGKSGQANVNPVPDPGPGPDPAVVSAPKDAATADELVALLRDGYRNLRLTGAEYDLTKVRHPDGQIVDALLAGDDVRLEGDTSDGTPPVVRVGYKAFDPEAKARPKTLTLRGPGGRKGSATVRGIHFVYPERDGEPHEAGLVVAGFDRVTFEECTFTPPVEKNRDEDRATGNGSAAVAVVLGGGSATFFRCYFARGSGGLAANGPGRVTASECALGPQHSAVRVLRPGGDLKDPTEVTLTHCSALLPLDGTAIEIGELVPCVVRAAFCLFAGPDPKAASVDRPTVLRQRGEPAEGTRYEADPETAPNGYYGMAAYANKDGTWTFAEVDAYKLPIKDTPRKLKLSPWDDRDPFAWLAALAPDAHRAFLPNLKLADLRVTRADRTVVLGTRYLGAEPLYDLPLPPINMTPLDPTVMVWDPSLSETAADKDLPPGVYPTLDRALTALGRAGTILIRWTGKLRVEPFEFNRGSLNVTIKPEGDSKPVLVPAPRLKRADGLFKLYANNGTTGRLVLDGLHFRLPGGRVPAVVVLPGGGQLEVRNSVITLEEGEDPAAILLSNPREEMMMNPAGQEGWPTPKVTLENVFVRGKGRLLAVRQSRPFELDVKNTLAALDGTLVDIDPYPAPTDPSMYGTGAVRLNRVTAYLGGSVLHVRAAERKPDSSTTGLVRTEVTASNCVFAPATGSGEPFARTDRLDGKDQVAMWLGWKGKDNVYGFDRKGAVLEIRSGESMPPKPVDGDGWLGMAQEETDPFAAVKFAGGDELPAAGQGRRFLAVRPATFGPPKTDPPRPEGSADVGAADVPGPFGDE